MLISKAVDTDENHLGQLERMYQQRIVIMHTCEYVICVFKYHMAPNFCGRKNLHETLFRE